MQKLAGIISEEYMGNNDELIQTNLEILKRYYLDLELRDILHSNESLSPIIKNLNDVINIVSKVNDIDSFNNML